MNSPANNQYSDFLLLLFVSVTTLEKLVIYYSWYLLLFKGFLNYDKELEDLDLRGENPEILGCQKKQIKLFQISVVHAFLFAIFCIFCVILFSISFRPAYVISCTFIFDFPVCCELNCLGVVVVKVSLKSTFSFLFRIFTPS